ncbi:MAG: exonuclease domain-containing protein [Sutterellaceae bacterium]|nr:exonuclease domain-containing protein [Sutterellaceae bacterium]MDY2868419.1 exonuclease domain-containing protein [Mesosutterella sp.]
MQETAKPETDAPGTGPEAEDEEPKYPVSIFTASELDRSGALTENAVRLDEIRRLYPVVAGDGNHLFLDTEFTGSGGHQNRIIEVGVCEADANARETGGMQFRCNPHRRSTPGSRQIHGIMDFELRHCRDFSAYADDLLSYVEGRPVVVHDASSDIPLLNWEYSHALRTDFRLQDHCTVIDSLTLARLDPYSGGKFSLDALSEWYGTRTRKGFHNAYDDATILSEVYREILLDLEAVIRDGGWDEE